MQLLKPILIAFTCLRWNYKKYEDLTFQRSQN